LKPADYLSLHIPAVGNPVMMSQSEGLDKRGEENQGTIQGDAKPQTVSRLNKQQTTDLGRGTLLT